MSPHPQHERRPSPPDGFIRIPKRPLTVRRLIPLLALLLLALGFGASTVSSSQPVVPTTTINGVVSGQTVTLTGVNFPPNQTFTVRMNAMGTRGVGGYVVGSTSTGAGTSFTATYNIPPELRDNYQVAIRLDSHQGYYSYNWFYNNTTGYKHGPYVGRGGYRGIPTISIVNVVPDQTVTFRTHNYPPNQEFKVTMGPMFSRGIGGFESDSFNSNSGGSFEVTVPIPPELHGSRRIAIRAQTGHTRPLKPFFSYNWFWNNEAGGDPGYGGEPQPPYVGIPTFKVCSVVRDDNVTIVTNNFPPNQTFTVRMGPMYTRGVGGIVVGELDSGSGGALNATFPIPDQLKGSYRISIRAETAHAKPYFAYNWFYNNTANVCP